MAALRVPVLPVLPVSGNANQPVLPTPPLGGGRNGKRERETVGGDLFGLEQAPPRILDRIRPAGGVAFMARDLRDVLREPQPTKEQTT